MSVTVYIEGGGNGKELRTRCRQGFSEFFRKAGLAGRMPKLVACGAREKAYDRFCSALGRSDEIFVVLLVDSEGPVTENAGPWTHLRERDNWRKPTQATDENAHLMVQCMEAWFFADKETLANYFGNGFNRNALSNQAAVENIARIDIEQGLKNATQQCKPKGRYNKGRHSFAILGQINPEKVIAASPHARQLIAILLDRA